MNEPQYDFTKILSTDTQKYSVTSSKLSVGTVTIYDGKDRYTFRPQEDITPYELALFIPLLVSSHARTLSMFDYWGYVKENNLERHFKNEN